VTGPGGIDAEGALWRGLIEYRESYTCYSAALAAWSAFELPSWRDLVNTGLTLDYVLSELRQRRPASLEVVTLLDRPLRRLVKVPVQYVGFQIPNDYVVGYGLDYRELYRNLPFICTLRASVFELPPPVG
jgi:hypothetical protein